MAHPPDIQMLHCVCNDAEGGESLFADGLALHGALLAAGRPEVLDALRTVRVPYRYENAQRRFCTERPLLTEDGVQYAPPFQGVLAPGDAAQLAHFYEGCRLVEALLARGPFCTEFRLQPGHLVLFDNRRLLHGRRAFRLPDAAGARHLVGGYVDYDDVHALLRRAGDAA